jgi:hypothetical protein
MLHRHSLPSAAHPPHKPRAAVTGVWISPSPVRMEYVSLLSFRESEGIDTGKWEFPGINEDEE